MTLARNAHSNKKEICMNEETIRTLITCGTTVLVALISNILVFALTKHNNNGITKRSISEEQYIKIFAPIDKLFFFDDLLPEEQYKKITEILADNYYIVPENIRISYSEINEKDFGKTFSNFSSNVTDCFKYLSSMLGYSREKLSRDEIKNAKKILNRKSLDFLISRNVIIFSIISFLVSIMIIIGLSTIIDNEIIGFLVFIFSFFTSLLIMSLTFVKSKTK